MVHAYVNGKEETGRGSGDAAGDSLSKPQDSRQSACPCGAYILVEEIYKFKSTSKLNGKLLAHDT